MLVFCRGVHLMSAYRASSAVSLHRRQPNNHRLDFDDQHLLRRGRRRREQCNNDVIAGMARYNNNAHARPRRRLTHLPWRHHRPPLNYMRRGEARCVARMSKRRESTTNCGWRGGRRA